MRTSHQTKEDTSCPLRKFRKFRTDQSTRNFAKNVAVAMFSEEERIDSKSSSAKGKTLSTQSS